MTIAYSYIRFSTPDQQKGDSLRRQTAAAKAICERKKWTLDESLSLRDLGVQAFRGQNVKDGALARFLAAIDSGRVRKGSVLIVERLDRLTRLDPDEADQLVRSILKRGIRIATVGDCEDVLDESDLKNGFRRAMLIMRLTLGHEESAKKSERLSAAWLGKRLRIGDRKLTRMAPAWLALSDDKKTFKPIPEKVALVKRIYRETLAGAGVSVIAKRLNAEGVPTIGTRKQKQEGWHRSYLLKILHSRAVLGEYQPHTKENKVRTPVGQPIKGYFPAVISETDFYRVQDVLAKRSKVKGPSGEMVSNLFTGLVYDARDRSTMTLVNKDGRALVSSAAQRGVKGSRYISFPYDLFERTFLRLTQELRLSDLSPSEKGDDVQDQLEAMTTKFGNLSRKIDSLKKRFAEEDDVDELADVLKGLVADRTEAQARIESLKSQASSSKRETLTETQSVAARLATAEPDQLLSLRATLKARIRQLVESIWIHVDECHRGRLAAVQVFFVGGGCRILSLYADSQLTAAGGVAEKFKVPAEYDLRHYAETKKNGFVSLEVVNTVTGYDYSGLRNGNHVFRKGTIEVEVLKVTKADLIRPALVEYKGLTPKLIAAKLRQRGVEVTPLQVAQVAFKMRQKLAKAK